MKTLTLAGTCVLGLLDVAPAAAQHHRHGAHAETMPAPAAQAPSAAPAAPSIHSGHIVPAPEPQAAGQPEPIDHRGHDMPGTKQGETKAPGNPAGGAAGLYAAGATHEMAGALGPYSMNREASGTAWQPDTSLHSGIELMTGGWMLMAHGVLNGVYDWQQGPRGGDKLFASGMVMAIARRDLADGDALQLKAMVSPDPLMGKRGYPLHLASGETANGVDPLIDRQHPHDLFMELSASYSARLGRRSAVFLYAGLPGEPAFGPPAFMHRMSIMDSPEAPISHHWLDSTHITFGVATAGLVLDRLKIEASRFNGREPDQHRYDIETGKLDSTAVRVSFNPTSQLSLQASWARLKSSEQLEPGENQTRWSASAIHTRRLGEKKWWSTTLAWGRRSTGHDNLDAFVLESALALNAWTLFGRTEYTQNNELSSAGGHHGPTANVGKLSVGAVHDFRLADHLKFGVGGLVALNFVPEQLRALYDGNPKGAMAFVRLKID